MAATSIQIPQDDLISEQQFAELVGKTLRTVRRWGIERKGPRRTRLGRSVYYSKAAIRQFLERQEEE